MMQTFNNLNLRAGEVIYLQNAKGEGITGVYQMNLIHQIIPSDLIIIPMENQNL